MIYPRTIEATLNNGSTVKVIDYGVTPPPDEGYLRCNRCGEQVKYRKKESYERQSEHPCPIKVDGQSMMGCGWGGWKSNSAQER